MRLDSNSRSNRTPLWCCDELTNAVLRFITRPSKLSSRATRYIRCRPSPSTTVNVYNMPACPSRARLNLGGSSRRLAPTHMRTRTHTHTHTRAHTHTRTHAHAHTHTRTPPHATTDTRTHAGARTRASTSKRTHTHTHTHTPMRPHPRPHPHAHPTTSLDNPRRQHLSSQTSPEGSNPGKPMLWAPWPAPPPGRAKANRPKARRAHQLTERRRT